MVTQQSDNEHMVQVKTGKLRTDLVAANGAILVDEIQLYAFNMSREGLGRKHTLREQPLVP